LVYDITSRSSFDSLDMWLREIEECSAEAVPVYLVANKVTIFLTLQIDSTNRKV
jgi:GTPase SAR1 family protein